MLIDARATVQARGEEFDWLTKATEGGHPEAAMTLAHRYLNRPPAEMDNDEARARAIAWFIVLVDAISGHAVAMIP